MKPVQWTAPVDPALRSARRSAAFVRGALHCVSSKDMGPRRVLLTGDTHGDTAWWLTQEARSR